ncbi:TPA: hypothetical protein ACKEZN_000864 [Clostridioides difficile]|uniref:hypothetical protein n=1 Tax=Clostridioides difficile TaxID=1496 RepID=UPI00038CFFB5|nr:hypothetical protein [Clostridioides difficile]EQI00045.1 hypothetical protein QO7_2056 [Clostridioides difficile F314]MCE4766129.1 hypothetical protein [Clostridioides difficile]MCI4711600.1 hypothetical protein [Clostridioides difficile]MCI4845001.1 hypothetical protein [Clostridioides difficile]MCL0943789.1 hypothetical protein [Clostridioides difficile]
MPPAPTYTCERTVKKRRGYYSEQDVFLSPCPYVYGEGGMYESTYYGMFNLDSYKNITVPTSTKYEKTSTSAYFISGGNMINTDTRIKQVVTLELIPDPNIIINEDLGVISDSCNISYRIPDSNTSVKFDVTEKLNDVVISKKNYALDGNYTLSLTDKHLSTLNFNSKNNITIELSTYQGGKFLEKTVTFTKGNTKPKLNISSYNSTTATFIAIDTDNNLSKIEWFIDDVLKDTFTIDLTTEKTINYELTDNAIHTLKIVATDAENATAKKVLSISKEIMPLPTDANLQDISSKLTEIGESFKNGKTSIINTLALKNIEASLNNTLVELSEKIKTSFDSSDASVEELQNIITQKNNTISQLNTQLGQRKRWAKGIFDQTKITNDRTTIPMNLSFTPTIIFVTCGIEFNFDYASALRCNLKFFTNLVKTNPTALKGNDENFSGIVLASIEGISRSSFVLFLKNLKSNGSTAEISAISGTTFNWTAIE